MTSATAPTPASAGAPGYRARRTLPFRVEAIRQFRRRRTLIALSILMILPWVLVGAFEISGPASGGNGTPERSEEHTSELQSRSELVCRLLLEKKKRHKKHKHLRETQTGKLVANKTI